ncbi:MAG: translocation/assembly module TamB domain-containing protein [Bdellovibrionales bacterium]|nr:translocation/assembly module TamB domain-containing protein [Bdellovibrionales bacterium]
MIKKINRKFILYISFILFIPLILFGFGRIYKKGKQVAVQYISEKMQSEIKKVGKEDQLKWDTLSISLFPLKIKITNVHIYLPDKKLFPAPLTVRNLIVELDYITTLLSRRLSAKITLLKSDIKISTKHKARKTVNINTPFSMNVLKKVPVSHLILKDTNLLFTTKTGVISTRELNAKIRLNPMRVAIQTDAPFITVGERPVFSSSIDIKITPNQVHVAYFKIKNQDSWLDISSTVNGEIESQKIDSGRMVIKSSFTSEDLNAVTEIITPDFIPSVFENSRFKGLAVRRKEPKSTEKLVPVKTGIIPDGYDNPFRGKITLDSQLEYRKTSRLRGYLNLSAESFSAWDVFLSQVQVKGIIKDQALSFEKFQIYNEGKWKLDLKQSKVYLQKPYHFKAKVAVMQNSQLNELFKTFHLKEIPVDSYINGEWKCEGKVLFKPTVECEGSAHFKKFTVWGEGKKWNILNIPNLKIKNRMGLENNIFTATTIIQSGSDSLLSVDSVLNEQGHFASQYTGVVHFSDIDNLVELDPKGILKILTGTISVDKEKINIQADLDIDGLVLSQFYMGNVKTQLSYTEKGFLHFRNINGQIKKSQYTGNFNINIPENTIQVFAHFPYLNLEDLKYALKDRVYFPFEITGRGTVSAYLNGPLKINALNYNLQAQLFKVEWEREFFNKATIQLTSREGHVKTKKVEFLRKAGKIVFHGEVDPKGNMTAQMVGTGLHLQESKNISHIIGLETTGIVDFTMNLNGWFLSPLTQARIKVTDSFYKGYPIKDSDIHLRIRRDQIEAKGTLADKLNVKKFVFPYNKNGFVELQAITNNLNIKEFFLSKVEATQLYNQFQSSINSNIDISYQRGQFSPSVTGRIAVNNITVHANSYKLVNQVPFSVKLEKGNIQTDPIFLRSGKQSLNITQNEENNINIKGNIKLDFLIFLFPFIRVWEGDLAVDLKMRSQISSFFPTGKVRLENGFIQLHPSIDPFEEIYSDMQWKKKELIFQSLYAKMGGGALQVAGNVTFPGKGKVPVNIKGSFSRVQFSSLPGIYAQGSGQVSFSGSFFPYTLGIKANIENARIEKEFISNESNQVLLSQRLFLLEDNEDSFEPIQMQLDLSLVNSVRVENSTVRSLFTGRQVKITGSPLEPLLSGKLTGLPGGILIFRDHEFEILSSRISYFSDKPSNPMVDLRAKTFVREERDDDDFPHEHNILLGVKGRGSAPVFTLTSTPSMTENEIVSLLAFGSRSTFKQGNTMDNLAKYSYYHLGPALFQKAIDRELKDTLGVDQFLIVPHISSKDHTTSTKLILRKKMFNRLNLSASQTILDDSPESDIKMEYEINKSISIIGLWRNEDPLEGSDISTNTIGLDLEYQIDF